jgi:hypothetical protein
VRPVAHWPDDWSVALFGSIVESSKCGTIGRTCDSFGRIAGGKAGTKCRFNCASASSLTGWSPPHIFVGERPKIHRIRGPLTAPIRVRPTTAIQLMEGLFASGGELRPAPAGRCLFPRFIHVGAAVVLPAVSKFHAERILGTPDDAAGAAVAERGPQPELIRDSAGPYPGKFCTAV